MCALCVCANPPTFNFVVSVLSSYFKVLAFEIFELFMLTQLLLSILIGKFARACRRKLQDGHRMPASGHQETLERKSAT